MAQPIATATPFGFENDSFFTNLGNRIYKMGRVGTVWFKAFDLPFAVQQEDVLRMTGEEKILVIKKDTNLIEYEIGSKKIQETSSQNLIKRFCSEPIQKIIFHKGVSGCFANNLKEDFYSLNSNNEFSFQYTSNKNNKAKLKLPEMEEPLDAGTVTDFLNKLPDFIKNKLTLADLGFTDADFVQCKNDIRDFAENKKSSFYIWSRETINMNQLLQLTDSLKNLNAGLLQNMLFHTEELVSTTSYSVAIKFISKSGETLSLRSTCYAEPNCFYFPWNVYINGYQLKGNWPEVYRFLQEIYPGFLQSKKKISLLYALVRNLYYRNHP
jgi:hypothetical protein